MSKLAAYRIKRTSSGKMTGMADSGGSSPRVLVVDDDPDVLAKVSRGLGEAMVGINVDDIPVPHRLAERGW